MANETKTYKKHYSFDTFNSTINADHNKQRQRILNAIQKDIDGNIVDSKQREVAKAVMKDLSCSDSEDINFKMTQYSADEASRLDDNQLLRYAFHRYRYEVYPKLKILDDYPPYVQIEPTSICNLRCIFCYQTDPEFTKMSNGFMGSMKLEMFKDIIDQLAGNVEFISLSSRGEPLICKDIDTMLEYCTGKFFSLKLNINASLLTERHSHAILSGGVNTIVFSVDAAQEPLYSQLRINGNLETILENLDLFFSIKKKHYPNSKIITRISGVKFNEEQNMVSIKNKWGGLADQLTFVNYNPWENIYKSPVNVITTPCSDLWRRLFIWYDGKVNPCDTDYKSTLSIGNIQKQSVSQIWCSSKYENLRAEHSHNGRSNKEPCLRCGVF